MSIVEFNGGPITHRYLMGKSKFDLARMYMDLLETGELGASLLSVWAQARENHERFSATGDAESDIRFLALGLTGEAGELANFIKKRWRDGDGHDDDIRKEIADVLAYAFMLADRLAIAPAKLIETIAEKQRVFIHKMEARSKREVHQP